MIQVNKEQNIQSWVIKWANQNWLGESILKLSARLGSQSAQLVELKINMA